MLRTRYLRRKRVRLSRTEQFNLFADEWGLEELREAVRRELRTHQGQLALARLIGVGRAVIRKFVEMRSVPRTEHLERIREWAADRPAVEVPVGMVALALLVEDLAPASRYRARGALARELRRWYAEEGVGVPGWLEDEIFDRRRVQ